MGNVYSNGGFGPFVFDSTDYSTSPSPCATCCSSSSSPESVRRPRSRRAPVKKKKKIKTKKRRNNSQKQTSTSTHFTRSSVKKLKVASNSDLEDPPQVEDVKEKEKSDSDSEIIIESSESNLSPCSSEEIALSIDHIRDSIFAQLSRQTLLMCRLVSDRWRFYASKELQKSKIPLTLKRRYYKGARRAIFLQSKQHRRTLTKLTQLMKNSVEFPCTSYSFSSAQGLKRYAQPFLYAHGLHIKILTLIGCADPIWLEDIRRILLCYSPNLEHLVIQGNISRTYEKVSSSSSDYDEPSSSSAVSRKNPNLKFNSCALNLKTFELEEDELLPGPILEELLAWAPNLNGLALRDNRQHIHPIFIHDLEELTLDLTPEEGECHEAVFNHFQNQNRGIWPFRKFILNEGTCIYVRDSIWPQVSRDLNNILEAVSRLCEKLVWTPMGFLNGLKIPKMPNVQELTLCYTYGPERNSPSVRIRAQQFFPNGINLQDTFPDLKSVWMKITRVPEGATITGFFSNVEPVPSVTKITFVRCFQQYETMMKGFQGMFPNAVVHFE